LRWKWIS